VVVDLADWQLGDFCLAQLLQTLPKPTTALQTIAALVLLLAYFSGLPIERLGRPLDR
jgi:hypothetical protein